MLGIALISLGTFFEEIAASFGKRIMERGVLGTFGEMMLQTTVAISIFVVIALSAPSTFVFMSASLPWFVPRAILEIIQAHIGILALKTADRTTFSFFRTLTIPTLLFVDMFLGYVLSVSQIVGILVIMTALMLVSVGKQFSKKGIWLVLFTSFNAAATTSLYKYDITHFNSIVAEQMIILITLFVYAAIAFRFTREVSPWKLMRTNPGIRIQVVGYGLASVLQSFALHFLAPSMMIAMKRMLSVVWSLMSGKVLFREVHLLAKVGALVLFCVSMTLLIG